MKVTSTELARLCNVSRATVDRVFNDRGHVNEETRAKILAAAESIGYRPHYIAQCLVTGRTKSIGLVIPSLNNAFFSTLLNAIARKAQEHGHIALVTLYEDRPEVERECMQSLAERQVDGFILFSTSKAGDGARFLKERGIPAVAVLNRIEGFPCVSIDYRQAMYDAASYVISRGYNHLVFLCPPLAHGADRNIFAIGQRLEGFLQAMERHGGCGITHEVIGTADYLERLDALHLDGPGRTAVLCSSDVYALEVLKRWKLRGVRVPQDVGLMGFDGIDVLAHVEPALATVGIPIAQLGEAAVQRLLEDIEAGGAGDVTLPYAIQPGQSIV